MEKSDAEEVKVISGSDSEVEVEDTFQQAMNAFDSGEYKKAFQLFEGLAETDSDINASIATLFYATGKPWEYISNFLYYSGLTSYGQTIDDLEELEKAMQSIHNDNILSYEIAKTAVNWGDLFCSSSEKNEYTPRRELSPPRWDRIPRRRSFSEPPLPSQISR